MMHMDTRHPEIELPDNLKGDAHLCLNLSYRFEVPDLEITDTEISVTLSFQKVPFFCNLPMDAIWGISQPPEPGMHLFFDALPPELLIQMMDEHIGELTQHLEPLDLQKEPLDLQKEPSELPVESIQPKRPALRLVVDNSESAPETSSPEPSDRSHLRVVPAPLKLVKDEDDND